MNFDDKIDRRAVPALKWHPMVLGKDGEGLFPAGVADMDFRAPDCVLSAMQARLDHGVFGYETVQPGLMPALRGWLAQRHGWDVPEAAILRAPNILNALAMAVQSFSAAGEAVIVQPPVFFDFYDMLRENGREIVENPLILRDGRYFMDFEALAAQAARPEVRMLLLCNPHNPMGRVWNADELRALGEICLRHDVLVVSDEMHGDLALPGAPAYVPFASLGAEHAQNAIICLSPAKTFNIAACCSAFTVLADSGKRARMQAANSRLTVNKNNAFANVAMTAAWESGAPWLERAMAYLGGNLALLEERVQAMQGVALVRPEAGFLAWLDFSALEPEPAALTGFLRQQAGWAVTRGEAFGTGGAGFARANFACRRAALNAALDRLEQAVRARRG